MSIELDVVGRSLPALLQGLKVTAAVSLAGIALGLAIGTVAAYVAQSRLWVARALAHS